jgi:YD repeat-containing protein
MKKRFTFALVSLLSFILLVNPLLTLAAGSHREMLYESAELAFLNTNRKNDSAKPTGVPSILKSRNTRLRQEGNATGQSQTLLADGKLLLLGGETIDATSNDGFIKDPGTGEQIPLLNKLQRARSWHTATMLPDGKILILGGVNAEGQIEESAEIFDPERQNFALLEIKGMTARAHHTATLLTDGRVLIAGGLSGKGKTLNSIELLSLQANAVVSRAKLKTARSNQSARLQASGDVLLWGGIDKKGVTITNGEQLEISNDKKNAESKPQALTLESLPEQNPEEIPRLAYSLPQDGAGDVSADSRLALRFTKPLRVDSINSETISLNNVYGKVEVLVVPAEKGMLAFITPKTPLLPGLTYTLSLSGSLDANNQTITPGSITFTTANTQPNIPLADDEEWIPDAKNPEGDWQSHRLSSSWNSLPQLKAADGVTALAGQALRLNGKPLANVMLQIGDASTMTDATGRFLLTNIAPGRQELLIHGHSANQPGKTYGMFEVGVEIIAGKTNTLGYTIWMPLIDTRNATPLTSLATREVFARTPRVAGLEVYLPAKAVLRSGHGETLKALSMTPIPLDRTPFPLPKDSDISLFFTFQTHGAKVEMLDGSESPGAQIIFPNIAGLPATASVDLWTHTSQRGWYIYGQGRVTVDGKRIKPNKGVVVPQLNCPYAMGLSGDAPAEGPPPGGGANDGDPVDLATGLMVLNNTDIVLPDTLPISISRTYRPQDSGSRSFGLGCSLAYDIYLVGDRTNYSYAELILPDGGRIRYNRTSPGTALTDAVMEHTATPSAFYKSSLSYNSTYQGWDLQFQDGTLWRLEAFYPWVALKEIKDRYGNKLVISRQGLSTHIDRISTSNGRWVELSYDGTSNRITQVRDNLGRTVDYTYDGSSRLWKVTDVGGGITEYGYDSSHRMTTIKDAKGITYLTNQYDSNGRVTLQTMADSTTYQLAYTLDGSGKVTQTDVTDQRGNVRRVVFNADGYATSEKFAYGTGIEQTVTYTRQSGTNLLTRVTDPLGRNTDFAYDSSGNVTSVTSLAGTGNAVTSSFTYNSAFNTVATVTDPLSHTTTFGYDSLGSLTSVTDALSHQSTFTYNSAGQLATAKDAYNNTASFTYSRGDLMSLTDPLGKTSSSFVDGAGRVIGSTNAIGQTVRYEYDALNRVTKTTDPLQGTTQFAYDANNNLLSVTDARSNAIQYVYDNMDRVVTRKDPLLREVTYEYFANGLLKKVTDRKGQETEYTYDALNRLTLITYDDASTTAYTYDAGNRVTQVVDSVSGTITYTYDDLDRLLSEATPQGTVSYTYDAAGRRTTTSIPGQSTISYTYDNADRLTQITQGSATVSYVYDNADRVTSMTQANGVVTEYGYDAASQLTSLTYKKSGVTIGTLTYEYNAASQRVKTGGSLAQTGLPSALTTTAYNNANHQTTFGSNTLTYDLNGNLTGDGTKTYTWNARNQLTAISGGVT